MEKTKETQIVKEIPLAQIVPSKLNPRKSFDDAKIKELAASIKEKGVIQAIVVRETTARTIPAAITYEIVCGERRYRASKIAGRETIPAVVKDLTDEQALEFQVIENLQREDVHPLEEAEGYEALLKQKPGMTVNDIAAKVGKSRAYVYGRMKLCDLTAKSRKLFRSGEFTPSVALLVARIPTHLQDKSVEDLMESWQWEDGMTYDSVQDWIHDNCMLDLSNAQFKKDDATLVKAVGSCNDCQKRTRNLPDLFPDVKKGDLCTDSECFKKKKEAHAAQVLAQAKAQGNDILSPDEAQKVFRYGYKTCGGYVPLNEVIVVNGKAKSYAQLAQKAKDAHITVAVHPGTGEIKQLLSADEAARIRKENGIKKESGSSGGDDSYKAAQKRAELDVQIAAMIEVVNQDQAHTWLRAIANGIANMAHHESALYLMKRINPAVKSQDARAALAMYFRDIKDVDIPGFIMDVVVREETQWQCNSTTLKALTAHYGKALPKKSPAKKAQKQAAK